MGYLTDPSGFHGKPFTLILNNQGKICFLLYIASIVWYCMLSHDQVNSGTYLSENALLPGLVVVEYNLGDMAKSLQRELEKETENKTGIPTAWLRAKLIQFGLEAYTQNYTIIHPLRSKAYNTGNNVYGIIRGGGASTESIVLSVPYRPPSSILPPTSAGLALVLTMAHYFRRQKYWAKDIIFLFTEYEQLGTQSWLEAYHAVICGTPGYLLSAELNGRGGSIQAAINIELSAIGAGGVRYLDVKLAGLNGQLPNLDLYNLVHRICNKERIAHTFDKREKAYTSPYFSKKYLDSFFTMGSMVLAQATGIPDGNHGLYHRFGIEAVTIEGYRGNRGPSLSHQQIGRVIEGVFRSINNLLERFHQSYFFYLLADYDRFVSIGYYMPCIGFLAGAIFIKAFKMYLYLRSVWIVQLCNDSKLVYPDLNIFGTAVVIMISYLIASLVISASYYFESIFSFLPIVDAIFYGYVFSSILTVLIPVAFSKKLIHAKENCYLLEICVEVLLGTLLTSVAMHNFSLAFVVGVLIVPAFLLIKSKNNRLIYKIFFLFCHPFVLLSFFVMAYGYFVNDDISKTIIGIQNSLTLAMIDTRIYSSSILTITTFFYLPNWILGWFLALS